MRRLFILMILPLFFGCNGLERSELEKIRQVNQTREPIYRRSDEVNFPEMKWVKKEHQPYPWEGRFVGGYHRITKEFFRCRGDLLNEPKIVTNRYGEKVTFLDCEGSQTHSLPLKEGKERIYPILIDLLNHVQEKLEKRVVITSGHRCMVHNTYLDHLPRNQGSKHLIGAAVDFYVEGMEGNPHGVVEVLKSYFEGDFERGKLQGGVSIPHWMNKEVSIQIHLEHEGRTIDNQHPYPYISLYVKYDREDQKWVGVTWDQAYHGYYRRS